MKHGKRYRAALEKFEDKGLVSPTEGLALVKETHSTKFDESVEVHFNLGIDPRHADQQLRGTLALPNGTGKSITVVVICNEGDVEKATKAGADFAGGDDLIEKISGGWVDFDLVIAAPDMMAKVGKLGRVLGAKGLMPNPKSGTVTPNIEAAVKEFKSGKIEYRNDKNGIVHLVIGKTSFETTQLVENFEVIYDTLLKIKPTKSKGIYFRSIALCSAMGPSVLVEPQKIHWKES